MAAPVKDITFRSIFSASMLARSTMPEGKGFDEHFYKSILESIINGVLVTDQDDIIIYTNKGMEDISGLRADEILGGRVLQDFPESTLRFFRPCYLQAKEAGEPLYFDAVPVITPAGRETLQSGWLSPRLQEGIYGGMICTVEDVTERKKLEEELRVHRERLEMTVEARVQELAEANRQLHGEIEERKRAMEEQERCECRLKQALTDKEVLFREINHRVKNSLQVASVLLKLQAGRADDPAVKEALLDGQDRIRSIALIHQKLQSSSLARVDLGRYISDIAAILLKVHGDERITFTLDAENVGVAPEKALPLGLIVNELITNALKYAFPGRGAGAIAITLGKFGEKLLKLTIKDDGRGFPDTVDFRKPSTLGLELVNNLVAQVRGTIEMNRSQGTLFTIAFDPVN